MSAVSYTHLFQPERTTESLSILGEQFKQFAQGFLERFLLLPDRIGKQRRETVAAGLELVVTGDVQMQPGIEWRPRAQDVYKRQRQCRIERVTQRNDQR